MYEMSVTILLSRSRYYNTTAPYRIFNILIGSYTYITDFI